MSGERDGAIDALNYGSGALSITDHRYGDGDNQCGIYANNCNGTDLTIEAADVTAGTFGIVAETAAAH